MLKRVEPLRNELKALEDRAQYNVKAGDEVRDLIAQLEKSIASYKEEYAQLISQAQAIKTDLENVQAKVCFAIRHGRLNWTYKQAFPVGLFLLLLSNLFKDLWEDQFHVNVTSKSHWLIIVSWFNWFR